MKLTAIKPIYHEGEVKTEGTTFETVEQHGRELVKKGYALLVVEDNPAEQQEQPKTKSKTK